MPKHTGPTIYVCSCASGRFFGSAAALAEHTKAKHDGEPCQPLCDYCAGAAEFFPSSETFYRKDYGPVWACLSCDAWVGCHPGTPQPLGRLANKALRQAKMRAHAAFDPLWKNGAMHRRDAYARLAERMGISRKSCHIGMFDLGECGRVVIEARAMMAELQGWAAA